MSQIPFIKTSSPEVYARRGEFIRTVASQLPYDMLKNITGAEVGVQLGYFSQVLLDNLDIDTLFLIDPWEVGSDKNSEATHYGEGLDLQTAYSTEEELQLVQDKFKEEISNKKVVLKRGFSYEIVDSFPDDYFDFIYIDACHLYDSVKADLKDFFPKLKVGGLMCGHDYINLWDFGVIQAVNEFVESSDVTWIGLDIDGDFCLKRMS